MLLALILTLISLGSFVLSLACFSAYAEDHKDRYIAWAVLFLAISVGIAYVVSKVL